MTQLGKRLISEGCLLYYITDRGSFGGNEPARRARLLEKIAEAALAGVDCIQLREKDLPTRGLESLAREAVRVIEEISSGNRGPRTVLLINSRTDVAIAVGAEGVHLRSEDISPRQVREIWKQGLAERLPRLAKPPRSEAPHFLHSSPMIGVSCHSASSVAEAESAGASFAVFAPVFEKKDAPGVRTAGLAQLRDACKSKIPVLALGGVALTNARSCLEAGAAGIAGIRLFQENEILQIVNSLRGPRSDA